MSSSQEHTGRVYLDLEYCYPGMTKEQGRPAETEKRQIVQMSAIKTDVESGNETASFDFLIKPAFEKELPLFFTELTGITQTMVDEKGVAFPEALGKLVAFCDNVPIWTFHNDWNVLKQNCSYFTIPLTLEPFVRVRDLLPSWGVDPAKYSSGTLHKAAHVEMHGHVHNALFDVRSMAAAVHFFEKNHG